MAIEKGKRQVRHDCDQQLDDAAKGLVLSVDVLIARHIENGTDIRAFFGAVLPCSQQ